MRRGNHQIERAVEVLQAGGVVAFPTETVYGLGCDAENEAAIKRIFAIKGRPATHPLIVHLGDPSDIASWSAEVPRVAWRLAERFWPGPLTLILRSKKNISGYITAGTGKVAVRIPGKSFALSLAQKANFFITATSANLSGMIPAQDADAVARYFGDRIDIVIDAGPTPGGLPSTIVDVTGGGIRILREGAISKELLREFSRKHSLTFNFG